MDFNGPVYLALKTTINSESNVTCFQSLIFTKTPVVYEVNLVKVVKDCVPYGFGVKVEISVNRQVKVVQHCKSSRCVVCYRCQ